MDVTPRIKAFIERDPIKDTRKDGLNWSVDSAVWYIEAGLNFGLATAWVECQDQHLDSLETSIPKTSGGIDESDAFAAYEILHASVSSALVPNENHLIVADVAAVDAGSSVMLKMLYILGSGYEKTNQLITSFGPNEFIYYGWGPIPNSSCGCGSNQAPTTCADLRIAQRVNNALPGLTYPCYYTDLESRGVSWLGNATNLTYNPSYSAFPTGIPATPYKTYFCQGAGTCSNCIPPTQMSFYTQGAWDLMDQLKPAGKNKISCVLDDYSTLCGNGCTRYFHACLFSYGKLNCPATPK